MASCNAILGLPMDIEVKKEPEVINENISNERTTFEAFPGKVENSDELDGNGSLHSHTGCKSCENLREEVTILKQLLHPEDDSIPESLWDIFPPKCQFLKNIMRFSGYETCEAILKLRTKEERTKMFDFVKSLDDIVEDKDGMFGIFKGNPQKLTLLPGHEPILKKFIDAIQNIVNIRFSDRVEHQSASKDRNAKSLFITVERLSKIKDIKERLQKWLCTQPHAVQKSEEIGIELENSFYITENSDEYFFHCGVCTTKITLFVKVSGNIACSNAQRHLTKACWLSQDPKKNFQIKQPLWQSAYTSNSISKAPEPSSSSFITTSIEIGLSSEESRGAPDIAKMRQIPDYYDDNISNHNEDFSDNSDRLSQHTSGQHSMFGGEMSEKSEFKSVSDEFRREIFDNRLSVNTIRATKVWLDKFQRYLSANNFPDLEDITFDILPKILEKYYASIQQVDGESAYKNSSLKSCRAALTRHFKEKLSINIVENEKFVIANEIFRGVTKINKEKGNGIVKQREQISDVDVRKLVDYFIKIMESPSPRQLQEIALFYISYFFMGRGRESLRNMTTKTFGLDVDPEDDRKYLYQLEEESKNQSSDDAGPSNIGRRMYEIPGSCICPVYVFNLYKNRLDPESDVLWQKPKKSILKTEKVWYHNIVVGREILNKFMKALTKRLCLSKLYTNHCLRSTSIAFLEGDEWDICRILGISRHLHKPIIPFLRECPDNAKRKIPDCLVQNLADKKRKILPKPTLILAADNANSVSVPATGNEAVNFDFSRLMPNYEKRDNGNRLNNRVNNRDWSPEIFPVTPEISLDYN